LLALLAANLILINKLYKLLRKAIKIKKAIKDSKLNILDKNVKYKIKEKFRDLEFCYLINLKSIIKFAKLLSCLFIDLIIVK